MIRPALARSCLVALVVVSAACGSGADTGNEPAVDDLRSRVEEIRVLASARQADQVAAKLEELHARVNELQAQGHLSGGAAGEIRFAADAVAGQLALITTTTTAPPTTTTVVTTPVVVDEDEDRGKEKGRGKDDDD